MSSIIWDFGLFLIFFGGVASPDYDDDKPLLLKLFLDSDETTEMSCKLSVQKYPTQILIW